MSEADDYECSEIRRLVWSGFYGPGDVDDAIEDFLFDNDSLDRAVLRSAAAEEFALKARAEADWPAVTDCDRLDAAFGALEGDGILALHDAGTTMADGHVEAAETLADEPPGRFQGYCFYHSQDVGTVLEGGGMLIAFDHVKDDEAERVRVGHAVVSALKAAGLSPIWDGDHRQRIVIPNFAWKRRLR